LNIANSDRFNNIKWRVVNLPDEFVIVQDTREQLPLFPRVKKGSIRTFNNEFYHNLRVVGGALKHGDYSVQGLESVLAIERKMLSDFYAYIGKERARTIRKLNAMKKCKFKALIIECYEDELFHPDFYGVDLSEVQAARERARSSLKSIRVKYGMHVYITADRNMLRRFVIDHLYYAYQKIRRGEL